MYNISGKKVERIDPITFSELDMTENDIEEILRNSIDMLCSDEESLLIVGRQVKNEKHGRSDLTAIDNNGNIVLIEIKRDPRDIERRKESFEFQAIRYAASYATIDTIDDLVKKVYVPYIEKYREEFELGELTSYELGVRKIKEFLEANEVDNQFNRGQKIILVASDFDPQTLSAVAWLNSNNVDMTCFRLVPYRVQEEVYLYAEKVLPVENYSDYYVNLMSKEFQGSTRKRKTGTKRVLPKIDSMLEWGVVKEGDVLQAKGKSDEAVLQANGQVIAKGEEQSLQKWLKGIFGWSSVETYGFTVHKESGKTLSDIRRDYMEQEEEESR